MIAAEAVFWYALIFRCQTLAPSRLRSTHISLIISATKMNVQALRHLAQRTCKTKTDEVMGGKNTGTFDGVESIFEPLLCGQLVQTSLSVCKCRPGDIHVRARVKLYSRIRSTVFPLSFCSARACHSAALPTHAQQVPRAKAL